MFYIKKKLIIAIEGIDGAGKTTLVNQLKKEFGTGICIYSRTKKGKFAKFLLNHFPLKSNIFLQIPIYQILSLINYFKLERHESSSIILMDRCFLSNICYFYPKALNNKLLYYLTMIFEVKIFPKTIFIIDEKAEVAQKRDKMEKSLEWLKTTRINYLSASNAACLKKYKIIILPYNQSIEEKKRIIMLELQEGVKENDFG